MKNIFITGATGFLGWNLAKELLKDRDSRLYLLVRRKGSQSATERVRALVKKSYRAKAGKRVFDRIEVIDGDITVKHLGIKKSKLGKFHSQIDTIYHSAALCEFGVPLKRIRKINVSGTRNVLDFALRCKKKGRFNFFYHVSTVGVAGKTGGVFHEDSLDVSQRFYNTYEQTKFEAEKLIDVYKGKGLSIAVFRPGIITGNSITNEVNAYQMVYQILHILSQELFDELPVNRGLRSGFVPVDYVAKAISLVSSNGSSAKTYHLVNPNVISFEFFLDIASGYFGFRKPLLVSEKQYDYDRLLWFQKRLIDPCLPYLVHKNIVFDSRNFESAVRREGFNWPDIDRGFLIKLFKFCNKTGYIKRRK